MTINSELRQVEALSYRPLDPDGTVVHELISKVRDALNELADELEQPFG